MDLLPVILSIAQAEDPPSVLGQIIRAIMTNEHVALARIWFLDQDHSCPVRYRNVWIRPLRPGE